MRTIFFLDERGEMKWCSCNIFARHPVTRPAGHYQAHIHLLYWDIQFTGNGQAQGWDIIGEITHTGRWRESNFCQNGMDDIGENRIEDFRRALHACQMYRLHEFIDKCQMTGQAWPHWSYGKLLRQQW